MDTSIFLLTYVKYCAKCMFLFFLFFSLSSWKTSLLNDCFEKHLRYNLLVVFSFLQPVPSKRPLLCKYPPSKQLMKCSLFNKHHYFLVLRNLYVYLLAGTFSKTYEEELSYPSASNEKKKHQLLFLSLLVRMVVDILCQCA